MSKLLVKLTTPSLLDISRYISISICTFDGHWTVCAAVSRRIFPRRYDSLDLTSMTRSILGFRSFTFLSQSLASSSSTSRKAPSNNPSLILATSNFSPSWRPSHYRRSFTPSKTSCVTESRETTSSHFVTLLCRTRRLSSATVMRTAKSRDEDFGKTA